eukprot:gnl/TRDRNA2_/TRDRNA2_36448_c0_seq1.p1 gnl/TRDRNA2_/TRDRNA2_36448_c0~~gnl/TRDRNA2_/TRDRNA2_36448_c0_seq1.p1  ORF type:complete len:315 (-),score=79.96 gnl/TRDRNA2_/TRDRNA2_36448_c0_seq1:114-1058(-)
MEPAAAQPVCSNGFAEEPTGAPQKCDSEAALSVMYKVLVEAEDEDDARYTWEGCISPSETIGRVAEQWAAFFSLSANVVGFEDTNSNPVDLAATPKDLGWQYGAGHVTKLRAVPTDDDYAEAVNGEGSHRAEPVPPSAEGPLISEKQRVESLEKTGREAVSEAPPARAAVKRQPETSKTESVAVKQLRTETAAVKVERAAEKPTSAPTAPAKVKKEAPKTNSKDTAPSAKSSPPAKPVKKEPQAKSAAAAVTGAVPEGDDPIKFVSPNPKKLGTASGDRFEKYMKAKTVNEALRLGACKGDIGYDFKKGYLMRA